MKTKVNFRITKDAENTFIRECKSAKGYNTSKLLAYLKNRGYENIEILLRMKF